MVSVGDRGRNWSGMKSLSTAFLIRIPKGTFNKAGLDSERWPFVQVPHVMVTPSESPALQFRGFNSFGLEGEAAGPTGFACMTSCNFPSLGRMRKCAKQVFRVT